MFNFKKSQLNPTQRIWYLGFEIDSVSMRISLPKEKVARIREECQSALQEKAISIRDLNQLIGRLTATIQAVLPAPLHYRNLQRIKNQALRRFQDFRTVMILDRNAREEQNNLGNWNGKAVLQSTTDMIAETDTSLLEWGARVQTGGLWPEGERVHHINLLELTAGAFVVKTFDRHRRNIHIHLKMDNKTAIFISTRWGELDHISLPIQLASCGSGGITSSAKDLPGSSNIIADRESWLLHSSAEWMLNRGVFRSWAHVNWICLQLNSTTS